MTAAIESDDIFRALRRKAEQLAQRQGRALPAAEYRDLQHLIQELEVQYAALQRQNEALTRQAEAQGRKLSEAEHETSVEFLHLMNASRHTEDLVRRAIDFISQRCGCEAVGIRLKRGDDYPYYETRGFPQTFVRRESSLCSRDAAGDIRRDSAGHPILECMCGNVIGGRFDPGRPFFTAGGSFWTNSTTELLSSTTEADRQARTRNRCNGEGYESVALIPLRAGEENLGLLQLNDRRKGRFSPEYLAFWERMAGYLAVAISRVLTREALRERERLYEELVENANSAIIRWRSDGTLTFFNEYAQNFFGYRAEEALGRHVSLLLPQQPSNGSDLSGLVQDIVDHPQRYLNNINENVCRDGRRVWMTWTNKPIMDHAGRVVEILAIGSDVTEQKRNEQALRESKERLHLALDSAYVISFEWDIARNEVRRYTSSEPALPSTQERAGTFEEVVNAVHPEDREQFRANVSAALAKENGRYESEFRIVRPDGKVHWLQETGYVHRDLQQRPIRLIGLSQDITGRKRAELELQRLNETLEQQVAERTALAESRARQLQALAVELIEAEERERQRIAELLHEDLQQILAGARFTLQSRGRSDPDLEQVQRFLEESIHKSRHLSHELSPVVLQYASLTAGLEWLCREMNERFGLDVRLEAAPRCELESTPLKIFLFRAVKEMLFNIAKHAGVKTARVALGGSDDEVAITVSDPGKGFDVSVLRRYTPNSGLGLISLRERASYIGGSLEIESAPGQGSRLTLRIPAVLERTARPGSAAPSVEAARPPDETAAQPGLRVLFADDHKVMRQGLIRLISGQPDITVAGEASNGREALELALRLRPDVIVMDISMPEMDGIEATRRIKAMLPEVRVIGLSMHDDANASHTMREAGAEAFVSKTASSSVLLQAIYGNKPAGRR